MGSTPVPPILFLVFNRPDVTVRVFNKIREARPSRLYVAADGPRNGVYNETSLCQQARKAATAVDWSCELKTLFRKRNLGMRTAVGSAIDWFFENEERGIILEDDCLPAGSFFPFCEELLERYKDDERIMAISGVNLQFRRMPGDQSYYFSRYNHCWGWASWRRAWRHYDDRMISWPEVRERDYLWKIFDESRVVEYWNHAFDMAYNNEVDSWAYRWTLSMWLANGLAILPTVNLVSNIGFGKRASHTKGRGLLDSIAAKNLVIPLSHPETVAVDRKADRRTFEICYSRSLIHRVRNRMLRLIRDVGALRNRKT